MTYKEVYLMDNLTIEAKAIYGMLCSYAGSGATAYPSVEFMCKKLHISNTRFYKHMNLLIGAGIVEKSQIKGENGNFTNNVYTLVPNLQNIQNPYTQNEGMENEHTDNGGVENEGSNNNNIKSNSKKNNNKNIICSEPDKSAPNPSGILIILNDKSYYDVPLEKITMWKDTYPAVDVEQELRKMGAWCDSNPTRRKTRRGVEKFINNWLSRTQDSGGTKGQKGVSEPVGNNTYNTDYEWECIKRAVAEAGNAGKPRENVFG